MKRSVMKKISSEKLPYSTTSNYSSYLPATPAVTVFSPNNPHGSANQEGTTPTNLDQDDTYLKQQERMRREEQEAIRNQAIVASNDQQAMGDQITAAYAAQLEGLLAQLTAQEGEINKSYGTSAHQAYIESELAKRNMPKILSAMGMSGGMSETAAMKQQLNYENNRNSINSERASALNDIDTARTQAQSENDYKTIMAQIDNYQRTIDAYNNKISELSGVTSQYNQRALDYQLQQDENLQRNKTQQQQAYMQAMDWENQYKAQQGAKAREEEYNAAQWAYESTGDRSLLDKFYMGEDYKAPVATYKPSIAQLPAQTPSVQTPTTQQQTGNLSFSQKVNNSILDNLYKTKSPEEFYKIINQAITSGQMPESVYNAWVNS